MLNPEEFAGILIHHGAKGVYWVGGCVRDEFLGIQPKDHDILIEGMTEDIFRELFPDAKKTGKKFPVFRLALANEFMEIAFARKEKKISAGHTGYEIDFSPEVTLKDDLFRRDLTINAIAKDILSGKITDPFHGLRDIRDKKIRAVSQYFKEDALRALRAARLAAVFGFCITEDTLQLMRECRNELKLEPMERVVQELEKALSAQKPSIYFRYLAETGILDIVHPELFHLIGQSQPEQYHPEGDAFEHSLMVLDLTASKTDDIKTRFSALFHDIGKGITPKQYLPKHHGHDKAGADIIRKLPPPYKNEWKKAAAFTAKHHMRVCTLKHKSKIVQFYEEMKRNSGLSMEEFRYIIEADHGTKQGFPWFLDPAVMDTVLSAKTTIHSDMSVEQIKNHVMHKQIEVLTNFSGTEKSD